jgi:hypothetical protein
MSDIEPKWMEEPIAAHICPTSRDSLVATSVHMLLPE